MRLLITTQAVDLDDPILGFFHRWIEEFSKHCESVEVICLREGRHRLPKNVIVHSLGKERGTGRLARAMRFVVLIWSLRRKYDSVFVHMNQEYVLLGGLFWKLLRKRVVLWRNHKTGSLQTCIAAALSSAVCYTSPVAYVAAYGNAVRMPIGIDTEIFKPAASPAPAGSILFLGRLDSVKKPEIFLAAMAILEQGDASVHADIYGDPTEGNEQYASALRSRFSSLRNVSFHAGISNTDTPAIYAAHDIYVNLTPSGSFDKTIGEAMASGCIVLVANEAVQSVSGEFYIRESSPENVAAAISKALSLNDSERSELRRRSESFIAREHSLSLLCERLIPLLSGSVLPPPLQ